MIVVIILVQDNNVNLDVYLNMSLIFATTGYAYYLTLSIEKD